MLKEKGSLILSSHCDYQLALCCLQIDPSCDYLIYFLIVCIFLCMALFILSTPNLMKIKPPIAQSKNYVQDYVLWFKYREWC